MNQPDMIIVPTIRSKFMGISGDGNTKEEMKTWQGGFTFGFSSSMPVSFKLDTQTRSRGGDTGFALRRISKLGRGPLKM